MKNKWIKIATVVLLVIFISVGSILLINENLSKQNKNGRTRNYIVATAIGNSDYHFPLPFEKGITAGEIARVFTTHFSHIQRKQGTRLINIESSQQIYSDIQIKIT